MIVIYHDLKIFIKKIPTNAFGSSIQAIYYILTLRHCEIRASFSMDVKSFIQLISIIPSNQCILFILQNHISNVKICIASDMR